MEARSPDVYHCMSTVLRINSVQSLTWFDSVHRRYNFFEHESEFDYDYDSDFNRLVRSGSPY